MNKANKPEEFPTFAPLGPDIIAQGLKKIEGYLENLSGVLKFDTTKIIAEKQALQEIIERVEKRRLYFHIFYDGCKMGELNEGALVCFWILKLHPFFYAGMPSNELNAKIALCLLTNTIYYYLNKSSKKKAIISQQTIKDLYYTFRFRDLSKEAIMITAESLAGL